MSYTPEPSLAPYQHRVVSRRFARKIRDPEPDDSPIVFPPMPAEVFEPLLARWKAREPKKFKAASKFGRAPKRMSRKKFQAWLDEQEAGRQAAAKRWRETPVRGEP